MAIDEDILMAMLSDITRRLDDITEELEHINSTLRNIDLEVAMKPDVDTTAIESKLDEIVALLEQLANK